jgi:small-conductance mechanosensitive channel
MQRLIEVFLTVCILVSSLAAFAAEPKTDWLADARVTLKRIGNDLATAHGGPGELSGLLAKANDTLAGIGTQAQQCVQEASGTLQKLQANLDALGAAGDSSDATLTQAKKDLTHSIDGASARLASCQAVLLEATTLTQQITDLQTEQLKDYLFARSQPVWTALAHVLASPVDWYNDMAVFLDTHLLIHTLSLTAWATVMLASAAGWLLGIPAGRFFQRAARAVHGEETTYRFYQSLCACLGRRIRLLLALLSAGITLGVVTEAQLEAMPLVLVFIVSLTLYLIASTLTRILLDPCPPGHHYLQLEQEFSVRLNRRLRSLWLVGFLMIFLFVSGLHTALEQDQWAVVRAALIAVLVANLVWLGLFMSRAWGLRIKGAIRAVAVLILVAALLAELLGYNNLSFYLLKALLGSVLLGVGLWFGSVLVEEFFDGMEEGRYGWQKRLRISLGLMVNERIPGLLWLRLLSVLTLWFFFGVGILQFWGYSDRTWLWVQDILSNGFEVGAVRIVPLQFVIGLAMFALFLTGMRWFKREVLPDWVGRTRLDRGGREAVITLTGYVGILVAALVGLSLAGFSLTNLAIVAGALSVGIGFGLQNIVNNFVSGIILLFERPIRTGDWIVAGEVQGFVRRISIRSTLIETFDRADVIVPNSALISNNVTNWMLRDPWGRVTVPIGVAYGSDVDKVTEMLMSVAGEHPLVMLDGKKVNPPQVLFMGFGESSLNFELRCFIREVDKRLLTLSDLNYAIEKKLRQSGIEIPFPQRDIHVRSSSVEIVKQPLRPGAGQVNNRQQGTE